MPPSLTAVVLKAELELDTKQLVKHVTEAVLKALQPYLNGNGEGDTLFTVKALAEYLEVSDRWIYERIQLTEIPFIRQGGFLRFRKSDIDQWLDTLKTPAMNPLSRRLKAMK
jgi:excisionase family DNA binding protein